MANALFTCMQCANESLDADEGPWVYLREPLGIAPEPAGALAVTGGWLCSLRCEEGYWASITAERVVEVRDRPEIVEVRDPIDVRGVVAPSSGRCPTMPSPRPG